MKRTILDLCADFESKTAYFVINGNEKIVLKIPYDYQQTESRFGLAALVYTIDYFVSNHYNEGKIIIVSLPSTQRSKDRYFRDCLVNVGEYRYNNYLTTKGKERQNKDLLKELASLLDIIGEKLMLASDVIKQDTIYRDYEKESRIKSRADNGKRIKNYLKMVDECFKSNHSIPES